MKNKAVNRSQGAALGAPLPSWRGVAAPVHEAVAGRCVDLVPADPAHVSALYKAFSQPGGADGWTFLAYGPFPNQGDFDVWMRETCFGREPLFFTVIPRASGDPAGLLSYLRVREGAGSAEIGHVHFGPALRRTTAATEAFYLAMRHVMDAGYRRLEWKCNALNAASRRAAERLGFVYEGTFRQDLVVKGRNRDTAWFSLLDREWPSVRRAFGRWLAADNFDADGNQKAPLRVRV